MSSIPHYVAAFGTSINVCRMCGFKGIEPAVPSFGKLLLEERGVDADKLECLIQLLHELRFINSSSVIGLCGVDVTERPDFG